MPMCCVTSSSPPLQAFRITRGASNQSYLLYVEQGSNRSQYCNRLQTKRYHGDPSSLSPSGGRKGTKLGERGKLNMRSARRALISQVFRVTGGVNLWPR